MGESRLTFMAWFEVWNTNPDSYVRRSKKYRRTSDFGLAFILESTWKYYSWYYIREKLTTLFEKWSILVISPITHLLYQGRWKYGMTHSSTITAFHNLKQQTSGSQPLLREPRVLRGPQVLPDHSRAPSTIWELLFNFISSCFWKPKMFRITALGRFRTDPPYSKPAVCEHWSKSW